MRLTGDSSVPAWRVTASSEDSIVFAGGRVCTSSAVYLLVLSLLLTIWRPKVLTARVRLIGGLFLQGHD